MAEVLRLSELFAPRQRVQLADDGPIYEVRRRGELSTRSLLEFATARERAEESDPAGAAEIYARMLASVLVPAPEASELLDLPLGVFERLSGFLGEYWSETPETAAETATPISDS